MGCCVDLLLPTKGVKNVMIFAGPSRTLKRSDAGSRLRARLVFLALCLAASPPPNSEGAPAGCGDGVIQGREECDDSNVISGDGCSAFCIWEPPIGIPEPAFGIHETVESVYLDPDYYTYWVDNSVACNDSNQGGKGSPKAPRCTIPLRVVAGDVVQVRGGPYTANAVGNVFTVDGIGTFLEPIFVTGDPNNKPQIDSDHFSNTAEYMIIEHLDFKTTSRRFHSGLLTHFSFRHNDYQGRGALERLDGFQFKWGENVVLYNNDIYNAGNTAAPDNQHGIFIHENVKYMWIIDNTIHHNSGDGIFLCNPGSGACTGDNPPEFIFIGRNRIYANVNNAIDIRSAVNVVISENTIHSHPLSPGSDGTAIFIGGGGIISPAIDTWILFNDIYNNENGVWVETSATASNVRGPVYLIGNQIHGMSSGFAFRCEDIVEAYLSQNTIYDVGTGLEQTRRAADIVLHIFNNIIADVLVGAVDGVAARSEMSNNLFWQSGGSVKIGWGGTTTTYGSTLELAGFSGGDNNILENPSFVDAGNNDFHLAAESGAIDNANPVLFDYAAQFCGAFGFLIPGCARKMNVDFDNRPRPIGQWDMGAFEFRTPTGEAVTGDLDGDRDVDLDDHALLVGCTGGPDVQYDPDNLPIGCKLSANEDGILSADADRNGRIDLADFGALQRCFSAGLSEPLERCIQ